MGPGVSAVVLGDPGGRGGPGAAELLGGPCQALAVRPDLCLRLEVLAPGASSLMLLVAAIASLCCAGAGGCP